MASITTTTVTTAIKKKWLMDLVKTAQGRLVATRYTQKEPMQKGDGGTLIYNRLLRPSLVTSTSTPGTLVTPSSAKALYSNSIEVTPSLYQDVFAIDDNAKVQTFIGNDKIKNAIANAMAIGMDYQAMKMLSIQGMRHRIDADTTYTKSGTCTSGSTTTAVDSGAPFNTTDFGSSTPTCYYGITNPDGPNYDHPWKKCTTVSTTTLTTAAFPQANTSSSKYRAVGSKGIVATDVLTISGLWDVQGLHDKVETEMFDDGNLVGFFDAAQHRDLLKDTVFVASVEYDNSGFLKGYKVARIAGLNMLISSNLYREDEDTVEYGHGGAGTTGIVYCSPIFGKNAFALTPWGMGSEGDFGVEWHITDTPDSQNLLLNATYIGWKAYWGGTVTRSTSVIVLLTGATSQGIEV